MELGGSVKCGNYTFSPLIISVLSYGLSTHYVPLFFYDFSIFFHWLFIAGGLIYFWSSLYGYPAYVITISSPQSPRQSPH